MQQENPEIREGSIAEMKAALAARERELAEAHEREAAAAEVLHIVSSSTGDLAPVFEAILKSATALCDAKFATLFGFDGEKFFPVAGVGRPPALVEAHNKRGAFAAVPGTVLYNVWKTRAPVHTEDDAKAPEPGAHARFGGARSTFGVPMLKGDELVGIIVIYRQEVRPFTQKQVELVQNFAAQAVIAIENARLFEAEQQRSAELAESLAQQTATADVLKVIASSPGDLAPVFDALVERAMRLCEADYGHVYTYDGQLIHLAVAHGERRYVDWIKQSGPRPPTSSLTFSRLIAGESVAHIGDIAEEPGYRDRNSRARAIVDEFGIHTLLNVALRKDGALLGGIVLYRHEIRPFTDKQIELVQNFAAQAVIAIENTRLLSELRESLSQQTATADVLKTISRETFDLPAVLDTLIASACRLCDADIGTIRYEEGSGYRLAATFGCKPEWREHFAGYTSKPDRTSVFGRTILKGATVHVPDVLADKDYARPQAQKLMNLRAALGVPLMRDGRVFGVVTLFRTTPRPFNQKQIELAETFADQAVIAIENVRLFEAEQQRTAELAESLAQQTATSEVLGVISSSPGDLQAVFQSILANATHICEAKFGNLFLFDDNKFLFTAEFGTPPDHLDFQKRRGPFFARPRSPLDRLVRSKQFVACNDISVEDPENPTAQFGGARTYVAVPMLKEDMLVGTIIIYRQEVRPFTEKQIALVQNFAAQAVIAIENTRLLSELRESLSQQTATADVLKVISHSTFDLQTVLQTLAESAARLCEAYDSGVFLRHGDKLQAKAHYGSIEWDFDEWPISRDWVTGRAFVERRPVHVDDLSAAEEFPDGRAMALRLGHRTILAVPLLREDEAIGAITIRRREVKPFTEKQIELVKTFADQAVIAIENVRLFEAEQQRTAELTESLEQQTATSEVLRVISGSPTDAQPVFDMIAESAWRLCEAQYCFVYRFDGELLHFIAHHGLTPEVLTVNQRNYPTPPSRKSAAARAVLERRVVQIPDVQADPEFALGHLASVGGFGSVVGVPILREGVPVGSMALTRVQTGLLPERQIELLKTFAEQAVIAIENARLFSELRDSLEQQTATSQVLQVISSSPGALEPVFQAMLENATRICEAKIGILWGFDDGAYRAISMIGISPAYAEYLNSGPFKPGPTTGLGRVASELQTVHIVDTLVDQAYADRDPFRIATAELGGARTLLNVPMFKDGKLIGAIGIYRQEVRPFSDKQVELVTNFASQAVIAIENTRLLSELRESLERQTATSEVLKVISSSPGELEPVFNAMLENATRICEAKFGNLFLFEGSSFRAVAVHGPSDYAEWTRREPVVTMTEVEHFGTPLFRLARDKAVIHIHDLKMDESYTSGNPRMRSLVETAGARTHLVVPMLKDEELIGAIVMYRLDVRPFSDKQIELVQNFAAQAVIAIENTRLLKELRESLDQQTATSDVLKVIASSTGELEPVFDAMLENATRICNATFGTLVMREGETLRRVAMHNGPQAWVDDWARSKVVALDKAASLRRVVDTKRVVHIIDISAECPDDRIYTLAGARTVLVVPMLKENELIGAISIYRQEVRAFTDKQIELVTNFAAQAVIAIENARLLRELRESLEQQTATSNVLEAISASPGDLAPVFTAMLDNAARVCDARMGVLVLSEGGGKFRVSAMHGAPPAMVERRTYEPVFTPGPLNNVAIAAETKRVQHIPDLRLDPSYIERDPSAVVFADLAGARTLVVVPMLKENEVVGVFGMYRQEVRPFTDKQIELLTNFAAQAVIAIENTRLLKELRESLEQQTATSDVLKVISSSPGTLEPVFNAMLENAVRICHAQFGVMHRFVGDEFEAVAMLNIPSALDEFLRRRGLAKPIPGSDMDDLGKSKQVVHTLDMLEAPVPAPPAKFAGARTQLAVPMLKDDELVGAIVIYRQEVSPFADKQIELVKNFAAQAVIAIENARLLNELRQRTDDLTESLEQQTATSSVLGIISKAPGDVAPVFDAVLENATHLCEANFGILYRYMDGAFWATALRNAPKAFAEFQQSGPLRPGPDSGLGRLLAARQSIHIVDAEAERGYIEGNPYVRKAHELSGSRTLLMVPMVKENELVGAITIYRTELKPFTDKQIELVQSFAAQAVIAIENARLLNELRESLEQQTATSEVLKVIASSTGELDPVFTAMLANAARLCEANYGALWLHQGDDWRAAAMHGDLPPDYIERWRSGTWFNPGPNAPMPRTVVSRQPVHVPDMREDISYREGGALPVSAVEVAGVRTLLCVPMQRDNEIVGVITIYRTEVKPFTDKQIELVQNFAAQAVIAIENARLLNELRQRTDDLTESLEQQTATSEVLKVISSSGGELQPVFDALLENATRLCGAKFGNLYLCEGDAFRTTAMYNVPPAFAEMRMREPLVHPETGSLLYRLAGERMTVHVTDATKEQAYIDRQPRYVSAVEVGGFRSMIAVPMLKDGSLIGAIIIYRPEVGTFSDKQIELVQNFAAQAVIAIENARLLSELRESLEQQTATSEVLKVIASSTGELAPVFGALLANATQLCDASYGALWLREGDAFRTAALHGDLPQAYLDQWRSGTLFRPRPDVPLARVAATGQPAQIADLRASEAYRDGDRLAVTGVEAGGIRTVLSVPMFRDKELVGVIAIYRKEVKPFADKQIELVQNFGAQAVIAIENARLLNELRQRTDDLTESLEYQTATSEILTVISRSPTDTQPVFDIIGERAEKLCDADVSVVSMVDGDLIQMASIHGIGSEGVEELRRIYPLHRDDETVSARAVRSGAVVHLADILADPQYGAKEAARAAGFRAGLGIPMIREGQVIGTIFVARKTPGLFTDNQVQLLKTFADQAVIAIGNVRLFKEVQARTEDLQESLQQQTATADVLKLISRSAFDLQPVLDTLTESATKLCAGDKGTIFLRDGNVMRLRANYGFSREAEEYARNNPIVASRNSSTGRVVLENKPVHIPDVLADPEYKLSDYQKLFGYRTILSVPLLRDRTAIGVFSLTRDEASPFTDKQIELVTTFADQAVIAIENARLFEEVQARTEDLQESLAQQTATADVLKVISRSTFDLQTVLDTLVESAAKLCEADSAAIHRPVGDAYPYAASYGFSQAYKDFMNVHPIKPGRGSVLGRAVLGGEIAHVIDVEQDPDYALNEAQKIGGWHSVLGVPLMREGTPIGVIMLTRNQVRPFTDKQIALATTFADQAAIAIENVRLLSEIQEKSHQLEEASKHKSQFLANMSHELRTPLNAILGYTELIADGVYGDTPEKVQTTLQRIVTNGKHLLGLINDVLDLSKIEAGQLTLSLSDYSMKDVVHNVYGAVEPLAAEKKLNFKVEIAPDLPVGHGDERRLTQVLLNLVGNSIKFTDDGNVTIQASLKDAMFCVAVHDTGPGISEEDQKKLFQEFQQADSSTTKKKGGTGLGLAISKRIIEMHGGRVWLESEVGKGSTFTFMVPVRAEQAKRATT